MRKDDLILTNDIHRAPLELLHFDNYTVSYIKGKLSIDFFENKPTYSRQTLCEQINLLFDHIEGLQDMLISNVDQSSWFSILRIASKSSHSSLFTTSFQVYYQFHMTEITIHERICQYIEIPIIGVLPVIFDNIVWLRRIKNKPHNDIHNMHNYLEDNIEFKQVLIKYIVKTVLIFSIMCIHSF